MATEAPQRFCRACATVSPVDFGVQPIVGTVITSCAPAARERSTKRSAVESSGRSLGSYGAGSPAAGQLGTFMKNQSLAVFCTSTFQL